jgi:hypothetical protein
MRDGVVRFARCSPLKGLHRRPICRVVRGQIERLARIDATTPDVLVRALTLDDGQAGVRLVGNARGVLVGTPLRKGTVANDVEPL